MLVCSGRAPVANMCHIKAGVFSSVGVGSVAAVCIAAVATHQTVQGLEAGAMAASAPAHHRCVPRHLARMACVSEGLCARRQAVCSEHSPCCLAPASGCLATSVSPPQCTVARRAPPALCRRHCLSHRRMWLPWEAGSAAVPANLLRCKARLKERGRGVWHGVVGQRGVARLADHLQCDDGLSRLAVRSSSVWPPRSWQ